MIPLPLRRALHITALLALFGTVPLRAATFTVAGDGSGDFKTVQQAIDAVPPLDAARTPERTIIRIKPGTYREKITIPADRAPLTLRGENAETTILTFDDHFKTPGPDGRELGTSKSASVLIQSPDFHAENLTFANSAGPVGQAVAVNVWSDRAVFRRCRFLGWQDTLLVNRNRQYFEECYITGHVDFIFGAAAAWFENCRLHCRLGGAITAASTPQEQPFGLVFSNCKITMAPAAERAAQNRPTTVLGRPWRPYASVTFLNVEMPEGIAPAGWDNWSNPDNEKTARYAEYRSTGPGAGPDKRAAWARILSDDEAKKITPEAVLRGWNPLPAK